MYTQCPDCATIFRLSAEVLRAAQGEVRCGVCATSFNAIENLSEQPLKPAPDDAASPPPDDSMTVEELPGGEDIELSSANEDAAAPAAELDPAAVAATLSEREDTARTDEYPILVLDERDEPEEVVLESAPRILTPEEMRGPMAQDAAARTALAPDFGIEEPAAARLRWPWIAAAAVLLLTLAAQWVHGTRESLVRRPGIGPLLAQAYELFGRPLTSPTDLTAFELRQWGAANDPGQQGRLLLRASIVNRADFAQPYPLLRLALQDRFGTTLFTRDIEPADYLPGATASHLLGPGERADAEIRIVDPGQDAVGFEMDVCLPADGGVRCASQITTAAQ
ncbi:MAG: zinc-ribbon and DUF3426 domain-containing protein [Gammaproteobacteria bacterium]